MATDTAYMLTGESDNLTTLQKASGLQTAHVIRHTKTGFLVQGDLLAKYTPTPLTKRAKSSWVWKEKQTGIVHGEATTLKSTDEDLWLCKACYNCTHTTVRNWLLHAFRKSELAVKQDLSKACSRITLSFDAWKSDNEVDYLGGVAHYIDVDFRRKSVLLALRNTFGDHTGLEMKQHLIDICKECKIATRIAFFMADNASNNDTAVQLLSECMEIQRRKQRLRCTAHSINLVAKAMIFGVDNECINQVIREAVDDDDFGDTAPQFGEMIRSSQIDDQVKLAVWRKKGPIGKLHRLVVHARASPARRKIFTSKQREAADDTCRVFELVNDGGIRWNSTHGMIERAIKPKDAIELYQKHFRDNADSPT
nr:hypothetical protein B0A51_00929 [Rachicladosporium sp. CCFEE 5018]